MDTVSDILKDFKEYPFNPFKIQNAVYAHLKKVMNNQIGDSIDATNPFAYDLESAAVLVAGACSYDNDLNRKLYPAAAMTEEDLYLHMCDKDYIGRFALPANARFYFLMQVDEVSEMMVYDPEMDLKRIIIPRNSYITVGETQFTMEYPVEIRELRHGGLQILIDHTITSPLQTLKTNAVPFDIKLERSDIPHGRSIRWLQFPIDMIQCKVRSIEEPTSRADAFYKRIDLTDKYYYARVFYQDSQSNWIEMLTTHSPDVYDVASPTAVLKVTNNALYVSIPQIYSDLGYLDSKIRIDVYETKGEINLDLNGFAPSEFAITFRAFDTRRDFTEYARPVGNIPTLVAYSRDIVSGGRNALSFKDLRDRVINNSIGIRHTPISNTQIKDHLIDNNFKIIKNIDQITNRAYLAARSLPAPGNDRLLTSAAASIEALTTNLDNLIKTGYVYNNNTSLTISPDAIYESKNGILSILPKTHVRSIMAMPIEERINKVNSSNYFKSPFHYVVDMSDKVIDLRAYYLDRPLADNKSFIDANDTTQLLQITVTGWDISRVPEGYRLVIVSVGDEASSNLEDDRLYAQLAFKPTGESEYAYINGKFLSRDNNTRVYEFIIKTNFDVNQNDELVLTNAKMYNDDERLVPVSLLQEFDIFFATDEALTLSWRISPIDNKIGKFLLPVNTKAIVNESIRLRFGYPLTSLWKRCRTLAGAEVYETYDRDIYQTYQEDILDTDIVDHSSITVKNNVIEYKVKHRKGDIVYDNENKPVIIHRRGDIKLVNSRPIIKDPRKILVQLDIMLIEWCYFLADHPIIKDYIQSAIDIYVDWITDSLTDINTRVLEQTKIYFYPRATLGQVEIVYNNSIHTRINAAQSLYIDLVVKPVVYNNFDLREQISKATIRVINAQFESGMISTNEILKALTNEYGFDVLGVNMTGLGQIDKIITMTILDDSKRCSLKKKLTIEANNNLFIQEDVTLNFIEHTV